MEGFTSYTKTSQYLELIHLVTYNFSPAIRYKSSPVSPNKKNFWTYMEPLYQELRVLAREGISVICDNGIQRTKRVHTLIFTGDMPAVAPLAGHDGHPCYRPYARLPRRLLYKRSPAHQKKKASSTAIYTTYTEQNLQIYQTSVGPFSLVWTSFIKLKGVINKYSSL
ncbi:hypothetical protein BC941DRAFT_445306 [Chlamydoabsidia padenii]|nr:hypothetical protein BC941DRAFT_445306 [Chlamydoabsidia padenii]